MLILRSRGVVLGRAGLFLAQVGISHRLELEYRGHLWVSANLDLSWFVRFATGGVCPIREATCLPCLGLLEQDALFCSVCNWRRMYGSLGLWVGEFEIPLKKCN